MKYILVRHGECLHNIQKGQTIPTPLCPLTDNGEKQSIIAAERIKDIISEIPRIKNIYLYFSPYNRTHYLANEIIKRINCDRICEEPLISEIQCGNFFSEEQYQKEYPQESELLQKHKNFKCRFWYKFKDGESPFDVYVRLCLFLEKLKNMEDGVTIVVSHNITLRVLAMLLLGENIERFDEGKRFSNGEVFVIDS